MVKKDWNKIKKYYVSHPEVSVADIAKKYDLSVSTITWHASREKWTDARESYKKKFDEKLEEKLLEENVNRTAARLIEINEVADKLLEKLSQAVEELGKHQFTVNIKSKTKLKNGERQTERAKLEIVDALIDTLKAQQISTSLKSLKDLYVGSEEAAGEEDAGGIIEIGEAIIDESSEESDMDSSAETARVHEEERV